MPFDPNTGIYTPPNGATDAFPGQIIASATWNSIFSDIATALTELGQQQTNTVLKPRIISVFGAFTVSSTDRIILVDNPAGTIYLPAAANKVNPVTIIGNSSTIFGSANSLILPNGAETISGLLMTTLTANYQAITLLPLPGGGWLMY